MKLNRLFHSFNIFTGVLLFVLGFGLSPLVAEAGQGDQPHGKRVLVLDVVADPSSLDMIPSPNFSGQGPFYIPGMIFAPGTNTAIGKFHCWGFFIEGGSVGVVSQEYDLTGRRKSRFRESRTRVRAPSLEAQGSSVASGAR